MKSALTWIKDNPITLLAAAAVLGALAMLLVFSGKGNALVASLQSRPAQIRTLEGLRRSDVRLPPKDLDGEPVTISITVNQPAIEQYKALYRGLENDWQEILQTVLETNREHHNPMMEGIFPDTQNNTFLLYDVPARYAAAFAEMFGPYTPYSLYPRLDAGLPPDMARVNEEVERVAQAFTQRLFLPGASTLTLAQMIELRKRQAERKLELLKEQAESIHIYADPNVGSSTYPFDIMPWVETRGMPDLADVWRGQMGLWIQADLVRAIGLANHVNDPQYNVMVAPVKQLVDIEVGLGAVGIETTGLLGGNARTRAPAPASPDGEAPPQSTDDFRLSPTGRRSNEMYDVWHVRLDAVLDIQRLPEFLDALSQTNFMTVLSMKITDVDEYQALSQGYVYGPGDAVRCSMIIETLWLREWTKPMMPKLIRINLGIDPRPAGMDAGGLMPADQQDYGIPPGMMMGPDGYPIPVPIQ